MPHLSLIFNVYSKRNKSVTTKTVSLMPQGIELLIEMTLKALKIDEI